MDVTLVLTHDCNLGCGYCFAGAKSRRAMGDEVMDRALDLAFAGDGPIQLGFFGGEPLIEWERLVRATGIARARAAESGRELLLTVTTNGTLLDEERVAWLVERGFLVGLSIDGDRAAHEATRPTRGGRSSFDRVLRGLDLLVIAGARLETITVVDPANVERLGASVRFLASRGVDRIALNPNFGADWSDAALAAWERGYLDVATFYAERSLAGRPLKVNVLDDKLVAHSKGGYGEGDRCCGRGAVAVAPSGNLYACARLVGEDADPALRIGHVLRGLDGRRMLFDARRGPVNEDCGGCAERRRCASDCACANREETGEIGVAGGVQCFHEKLAMRAADAAGRRLWRARSPHFLARVYGYACGDAHGNAHGDGGAL
jgi:uncharacterized protein